MALHILTDDWPVQTPTVTDVVPNPVAQTLNGMAVARSLGVAARTGVFGVLAERPSTTFELANRLGFEPGPLRMMLDLLVSVDVLSCNESHYSLSVWSWIWLDPDSPSSITTALSHTLDLWDSLANLEQVLIGGASPSPRPDPDDEAGWLRHVRSGYEMARLVADDVAAAIGLPDSARAVLDLGSGHGWFAAAMCRRNPELRATVIDVAGAVQIGREIIWEAGLDEVVTHQAGDIYSTDLGGEYDVVVCQPMIFDLSPAKVTALLRRIRRSLRPGGVVAIIRTEPDAAALRLVLCVRSGGDHDTVSELGSQLTAAGFGRARVHHVHGNSDLAVHIARAV